MLQVDLVVRLDLGPLFVRQDRVWRVGQLPKSWPLEVGGDRLERREPASLLEPRREVDVVNLEHRAVPQVDPRALFPRETFRFDDRPGRLVGVPTAKDRPDHRDIVGGRVVPDERLTLGGELAKDSLKRFRIAVRDERSQRAVLAEAKEPDEPPRAGIGLDVEDHTVGERKWEFRAGGGVAHDDDPPVV